MKPRVSFFPVVDDRSIRSVHTLLGTTAAVATASGGWAVVSRPKKKGFTTWQGYEPYQMTLTVMFDGLQHGSSVEHNYEALRRIMRVPVGKTKQPSPVKLKGPLPLTQLPWVIQDIQPDEASIIRRQKDGHMIRVSATVTLLEYVEADVAIAIKPSPAKKAAAKAPAPPVRTHTVVRGDTLWAISTRFLGAGKRYPEIAKLNNIRDPHWIYPGQVLRIP